jgi:putative tryptophan/tyrosine transport system substrate-binding protein
MKRRKFIALAYGATVAWGLNLEAKARDRGDIPLIGLLSLSNHSTFQDGLAQGLHDLGYAEGQSIYVDRRFAGGKLDRLPELAKELVQLQPRAIVAGGSPSTLAVSRATNTIPVVMVGVVGPPWAVPIQSLARPGGHITGLVNMNPDLSAKRLQLLREMIPSVRRVNVLVDVSDAVSSELMTQTRAAAHALGLMLNVLDMRSDADYQRALSALVRGTRDPILVLPTSLFLAHRQQLAEFFLEQRIPSVFGFREHVEVGGLLSYSASLYAQFYRAAAYVDKILKGANPADLPVEQPTKFELVINLKTAKALGLAVPESLLARADEVID